ncbi:hypothetical protein [Roseivivax sp. CAU 1761]
MQDLAPSYEVSPKSMTVIRDGFRFRIQIFRFEGCRDWSLEIVDQFGNTWSWDDPFLDDGLARAAAIQELENGGGARFMFEDNVVPFIRG